MAKKGQSKKGIKPIELTFTYMTIRYTMTTGDMGRFFGVGYDKLKRRKCQGMSDQDIANEAAIQGGNKPRVDILRKRLAKRKLVLS